MFYNIEEIDNSNMLPTAAALMKLALAVCELLDSQDRSVSMFMGEMEKVRDYNDQLELIIGTLSNMEGELFDFDKTLVD